MRRLGFKKQKIYGDMIGDYYIEECGENELKKNMLGEFNDYNKINSSSKQINIENNLLNINNNNKVNFLIFKIKIIEDNKIK